MSDNPLPTVDEALGPRPALPTLDQALGPKPQPPINTSALAYSGADMDEYFSQGSAGQILNAFGQGAKDAWGAKPLGLAGITAQPATETTPEVSLEQELERRGFYRDVATGHQNFAQSFNEQIIRPAVIAADAAMRSVGAGIRGFSEVLRQGGVPSDLTPEAYFEAFPLGPATPGFPRQPVGGYVTQRAIARAADLDVIGKGEAGWKGTPEAAAEARQALVPTGVESPTEQFARGTYLEFAPPEPAAEAPPDIHAVARQIAPDTFAEYDALSGSKDTLTQRINELGEARSESPEAQALQAQMDTIMARVHGREIDLTTAAQRRYNTAYFALNDLLTQDTPEMADLRQQRAKADEGMRDLAPQVSAAYREAQERMPPAEAPPETPPTAAAEAPAAERPAVAPGEAPVAEPTPAATPAPAVEPPSPAAAAASAAARPPVAPIVDDPLALQRRGELTAARAGEIRDGLTRTPPAEGAADHLDTEMWKVIAGNLGKAEASREGGVSVVADQMRYMPDDGVPKTISHREAVAVIARALDAEAARGGDVRSFLADADAAYRAAGHGTPPDVTAAETARAGPVVPTAPPIPGGIAGEVTRQLIAAGRPAEEAKIYGAYVQARYETRAAAFGGAKGTAEDMFRGAQGFDVRAARGALAERALQGELAQRGVTGTVVSDNAIESARTDQGQALPARVPTGKNPPANRLTDANAIPDLATLRSNPRLHENTVNAVGADPGLGHNGGPPLNSGLPRRFRSVNAKSEYLINRLKDNLLWLYDQVPAEIRDRSRLWYDGAQAISTEWAARWDLTRSQTAGMLAVLSPQKDWFMNTTMAERIGDILHRYADHRWDAAMDEQAFKFLLGETATSAVNRAAYEAIKGKTLREVAAAGDPVHTGMWLRAYDEAHHGAAHAIITPEGAYAGNTLTAAGDEARRAWGDFGVIGKAASIFFDGSPENISRMIGAEHKVRNFYNNIFNASDPRYVTIDTHAVAADELRPVAGKDKAVEDNFGGTGSDRATGLKGSYALHAEAYRRAAAERGILPREMQSVTWEAVRGLFPDSWKTVANKAAVDAIWNRVGIGELSIDDARNEILALKVKKAEYDAINSRVAANELTPEEGRAQINALAQQGGIDPPTWVGQTAADHVDRTSTYPGTREPSRGAIVTFEVAPDPRNPALVARWRAIPDAVRERISHSVAWQVSARALEGANEALWGVGGKQQRPVALKAELVRNNGAWRDDPNPSLSLRLDPSIAPAKVGILARLMGYALRQEETLRTSPKTFPGGAETDAILVPLPREATPADIHSVYQQIRELKNEAGEPYVIGHTTGADGVMQILNNNERATIGTAELVKLIDEKLGGKYDIESGTLYAERVEAGSNEYGLSGPQVSGRASEEVSQQSLRRAGDNLRREAQQHIEDQLSAYEGRGATEPGVGREPGAAGEPRTPGEPGAPRGPPDELEQTNRAKIRLATADARAVVTLFKNADASSFGHEMGHKWLEELKEDAADPRAPEWLKADWQTTAKWLGLKEGEPKIPTRAHEKFARGHERFMMEGHAPSRALAGVFAKFRDWLIKIYQTVDSLHAPINDDIRGVYRRLVASREAEPVIAPESATSTFADMHEADALRTEPSAAGDVADTIRDERDNVMEGAHPEIQDERSGSGTAPPEDGGSATGGEVSGRGGAAPGDTAVPAAGVSERGADGEGRGNIAAEGNRTPVTGKTAAPAAPNAAFGPSDERLIDKAGNIRLDNLNIPDDVEQAIRDAAERNNGFITARRGVITDGQMLDLAEAIGKDPAFLSEKKIGAAFSAEEILAARKLLVESATAVRDAMTRAATGTDADVAAMAQAVIRHEMIQAKVAQATAEWGRAGRAFRALEGWEGARDLNQLLKDNTGRTLNQLRQMAQLGQSLKTPAQVSKLVADTAGGKVRQAIIYYWVNTLISGPVTHFTYSVGNALNALWTPLVETPIAATSGAVRAAMGIQAADRVYFNEVTSQLYGLGKGFRDGLGPALEAWKTGVSPPLPGERIPAQFLTPRQPPIPGIAGRVIGVPGRAVSAIHSYFKTLRYEQNIQALAMRDALNAGLEGAARDLHVARLTASPTDAMMASAVEDTLKELYMRRQDYNSPGALLSRATSSFLPAKIVAPFVKIGSEIVRNAFIERTPLGIGSAEVRGNLLLREGGAAFDQQLGKVMAGTGLIAAMVLGVLEGNVTGDGPSDPDERRTWMLSHKPNHVTVGPISFSYARLGHLGMLSRFAANMTETAQRWNDQDGAQLARAFFEGITRSVLDETWMRGVKDFFDAIYHPDEHFDNWVTRFVAQWTPYSIGLGQVARTTDPYQRETRDLSTALEILNQIKAHTPLWSQTLPPSRDMFGEPITTGSGTVDRYANDKAVQAMDALHIGIGRLDHKIRGVPLTPQQYDDYARVAGRMVKMELDAYAPILPMLAPVEAIKLVKGVVTHNREAAASQVMIESMGSANDIMAKATDSKSAAAQGASPLEVKEKLRAR